MSIRILTLISSLLIAALAPAEDTETAQARVLGGPPNQAQYLFEVQFTAIDGENIVPRDRLLLDPGTHTLTVRIPAEYTEAAVGQNRRTWSDDVDVEVSVEAGEVYRVRGKWNRSDLEKPYELVVEKAG